MGDLGDNEISKPNYVLLTLLILMGVFISLMFVLPRVKGDLMFNIGQSIMSMFFLGLITLSVYTIHVSIPIIFSVIIAFKTNSKFLKTFSLIILPLFLLTLSMFVAENFKLYGILPTFSFEVSNFNGAGGVGLGGYYYLGEDFRPLTSLLFIGIITLTYSITIFFIGRLRDGPLLIIFILIFFIFIFSLFLLYSSSKEMSENYLNYQCTHLFNYILEKKYGVDFSLYADSFSKKGEELLIKRSADCKEDLEKQLEHYSNSYAGLWKEKWSRVNETDLELIRIWAKS